MDIDEMLNAYLKRFSEYFPMMCFQNASQDEICKHIEECILTNRTISQKEHLPTDVNY